MDITAIFNFLLIAGVLQGFVFNIGTLMSRKRIEKPVLFLNLFILFLSLNNLQAWLIDKKLFELDLFFRNYPIPWYVLIVPMFYAFLVYFLGIEQKKWPFLRLTLAIFLFELVGRIILTYSIEKGMILESFLPTYNNLEDGITFLYSVFLYGKALGIMFKYENLYQEVLAFDNLRWIKRFLILGGVVMGFWLIAMILNVTSSIIKPPYSYYPLRLGTSILIYWVGYQAFFQFVILKDRISLRFKIRNPSNSVRNEPFQELHSSKKISKEEALFEKINLSLLKEKRYLDPLLSLETLAEEWSISTSTLSKLINTYSTGNFSDYINTFRVDEAKKLLDDPDFKAYTMVSIGLECGFNSRSTFYAAFKKLTDTTPKKYRGAT